MNTVIKGGRAGGCDWNPTASARPPATLPGVPQAAGGSEPSDSMVPSGAEIEGLLSLLAWIVRRLAAKPPPVVEAPADETARDEREGHRARRSDTLA
jgi:hypothetical protein